MNALKYCPDSYFIEGAKVNVRKSCLSTKKIDKIVNHLVAQQL